jgi:hypothetical protein
MSGVDMADIQADGVEMGGLTVLEVADMKVVSAEVITEAMSLIDTALSQMVKRELVSSGEVSDLLLDVRNLLTSAIR